VFPRFLGATERLLLYSSSGQLRPGVLDREDMPLALALEKHRPREDIERNGEQLEGAAENF